MDRLWATWRMPYIESVGKKEGGCIFCDKPAEESDEANHILLRRGKTFVILNAFPYNPGHIMIAPFRHVGSFDELTSEEGGEVISLLALCERVVRDVFRPEGINMGVNEGRAAGAGVPGHLHIHLVPRWQGDTNFMPLFGNARVIPQGLDETGARLRESFARHERER